MIRIALCDDDRYTLRFMRELIEQAIEKSGVQAQICCVAGSGQELWNYLQQASGQVDLCFLDYDFGAARLNGVDLLRRAQEAGVAPRTVFVTSHASKGMEILRSGVQAFGFIEKNVHRSKMVAEFARYLAMMPAQEQRSSAPPPSIALTIGIDETVCLPLDDVLYVESDKSAPHTLCYHTCNGSRLSVRDTLEHAVFQLGDGFVRSHRSVTVNLHHVLSIEDGQLRLTNGEAVACSFGRRKEVLRRLQERRSGA